MKINFNSITTRTLAHVSIFTIAFILFITFVVRNLFTESYQKLEQDKLTFIAKSISRPIALNLSYGFDEAVNELLEEALEDKNILFIKIDNEIVDLESIHTNSSLKLQEHINNKELINTQELYDPITLENIGTLTIVYSSDSYKQYMINFNKLFLGGVLIFALVLFLLTYFLYKSLSNLATLAASLKIFNPKNPQKIDLITTRKDEVFSIVESANIMIENIILFLNKMSILNSELMLSQSHLKDAQRMAKVGSVEYNLISGELVLSDEYYRLLGVPLHTRLSWNDLLNFVDPKDKEKVKKIISNAIREGVHFNLQYKLILKDKKEIYLQTHGKVIKEQDGSAKITAISMDVTRDIENKNIIEKLAYYDPLTGLVNRTLLKDRVETAIKNSTRSHQKMAVLFLDLDHFKLINDTLGHNVGDELLIHIANLLQEEIRETDTLSRLGGDEFVVVLESVKHLDDVEKLANKILHSLNKKHIIGTHELYLTSSMGVSIYPQHGSDYDTLVRSADTAMYEAKSGGRNCYKLYSDTMGNFVDKQHALEQDLSEAVKTQEQIRVYYQAKVDTISKQVIGAEALVRWEHPTRGLVFPNDFIYMAESTGLMVELGNIIIDKSIAMIEEINALGFIGMKMAINLSARQFGDDSLVSFISTTLKKYKIDPSQVEFEITETISMSNIENTLRILHELKDIGVSIAIDDFGTGYSSLSYLKKFPIDTLKVDQSFVMGIVDNEDDRIIAQTIISMAHSLGFKTVAEGVETEEHVEILENMDCDILQGYYYSKPIDKEKFIDFLKEFH